MTEEEAKQKWCPMVRYLAVFTSGSGSKSGGGYNRGADHPATTAHCIGSACMMWRTHAYASNPNKIHGYCGLAGKP